MYVEYYDGDPEAVLDAISAVAEGRPKPVVASVLRADGRLPARTGVGVPNFLFPESCAAVLARAAERREWLSRPLGEPPRYPDLDRAGARELISSFLDREPSGGWLTGANAEALLATTRYPDCRVASLPRYRARHRRGSGDQRSGRAEGGLCRSRACQRHRRRAARGEG